MRWPLILAAALLACASRERGDALGRAEQPFRSAGALSSPRSVFGITALKTGEIMVASGLTTGGGTQDNEHWDPATSMWSAKRGLSSQRGFVTATTVASGKVVVIGGFEDSGEIYDPVINEWAAIAADGPKRVHSSTLLTNGKVLVLAHNGTTWTQPRLYDATTNAWSAAGTMTTPREDHLTHVLYDGRVLVAGGYDGTYLSTVEIYAPATNTWTSTAALGARRANAAYAELPDKRILIAGGTNGGALSSAEIYNTVTGTTEPTSSMTKLRDSARAIALSSGRVLVIGGDNGMGNPEESTEVYDPATKKWSTGPTLAIGRHSFGAMQVSGGRVLVVGGRTGTDSISTAELFGGLALDAACVIDEECTSGKCTASKCAPAPIVDTGADVSVAVDSALTDTGTPAIDSDVVADTAAPAPAPAATDDNGCGCRTAHGGETRGILLFAIGAALLLRRRDNSSSGARRPLR